MRTRKSNVFIFCLAANLLILTVLAAHGLVISKAGTAFMREERLLVEEKRLTDICLFTDAPYTRNPSMADIHSCFQDNPMSLDPFPSGSLMTPPPHLTRHGLD